MYCLFLNSLDSGLCSLSKHSEELKILSLSKKVDPRSRLTPRASRDRWEVEDEHEEGGATTATDYGGPVARRQSGDAAADDGEAEQTRRAQERKTRERAGLCGDQQEDVRRDKEQQGPEGPCGRRLVLVPHREDDPGYGFSRRPHPQRTLHKDRTGGSIFTYLLEEVSVFIYSLPSCGATLSTWPRVGWCPSQQCSGPYDQSVLGIVRRTMFSLLLTLTIQYTQLGP